MKSISAKALERLSRKRRFSTQTLEIAKRFLIDAESPKALAAEYGLYLQRIYAIGKQVGAAAKSETLPSGWEEVTLVAPRPLIREVRKRIASARKAVSSR